MTMRRARRVVSKAARNEQRKLLANVLNNTTVAALLAGYLQPVLAFVRNGRFGRNDLAAALVFGSIGLMLHVAARAVVSRVED